MKKVFLYLIAGLVCMTGMTGCGDENNAEDNGVSVPLTGITVDPPSLTILANSKQKLTATPVPADATGVWFEWSSSDPSVATVYSDGTVFVKKYAPGTTTLTVKSGSIEVTVPVSVQEVPLTDITVDVDDAIRMPIPGATVQVKTKLEPANATGVELVWRSENPNVATVDSTGKITAVADGTTNISVSFGAVKTTIEVSVGLEDIIVEPDVKATMYSVTQIIATSVPRTDYPIPYIWRSENPDVATVDDGWVTPVSKGTTNITVTYGAITKSVQVTVAPGKFPKEGLSVVAWSDGYTGGGSDAGGVAALFDNNYGSPNWHSGRGGDYNASSFPYWFVVDLGSPKTVTKIVTQFQHIGRTARMRCYISNSNSITTQGTGNSAIPNPEAWGTKISDTEEWNDAIGTVNMLSNATAGRYLLLYLYEPGPNDGDHHTNILEIDVYGY